MNVQIHNNTFLLKNVVRIRNFNAVVAFLIKIDTTQLHSYIEHFFTCSTHNIRKMKTRYMCKIIMITTIVTLICEIVNIISNLIKNTPAK